MRRSFHGFALTCLACAASAQDLLRNSLPEIEVLGEEVAESRLAASGAGEPLVIGPEVLRAAVVPSLADLLRQQAGLNFTSFFGTPASGVPQLRGFGEGASSRVLILLDGLPMNRPDLASPVWFEFPLAGLERVELQRGSRTVRFGSSALAGVISLETRREVAGSEWHFQGSTGSWNTTLVRLQGLHPVGKGWVAGASFDAFTTEGWRENSAIDSRAFSVSLSSPDDSPWQWQSTLSGTRTDLENPGGLSTSAYRDDPRQSVYTRFGLGDQFGNRLNSLRTTQQVRFHPQEGQLWQLGASWTSRQRELNFGPGRHTDHDLESFAFDLCHDWERRSWSGSWGLRGRFDTLFLERFRDEDRAELFAAADLERQVLGGFAQAAWQFHTPWTLAAGVSWDAFDLNAAALDGSAPDNPLATFTGGTDDATWGGEVSLEYQPDQTRRVWLRFDRVFRFPLLDEIVGYQGFLLDTPVNAALEPESGYGVEWGAAYSGRRLTASVAAFAQRLDGEILFDFTENLNTNFARSRRLGLESRLAWRGDRWRGSLDHQWIAARFDDGPFAGRTIPLVPEHQLSARLTRELHPRVEATLEWEWLTAAFEGGDFANTRPRLPGRSLVHLEGRFDLRRDWEAFGRVDNLFDESWASLKFLGQWYPGNARSVIVGVRGKF